MVIYLIKDYEIRYHNSDEVLYIYLDFNSEFAKLNSKKNKKKLKKVIEKFIKGNNIDFKGNTIAIIIGGIIVGTIVLNKPLKFNNYVKNINDNYIVSLVNEDVVIDNKEIMDKQIEESKVDEVIEKVVDNNVSNNKSNYVVSDEGNSSDTMTNSKETIEEVKNGIDEVKTYVTVYRSNGEVLNLELEEYLVGVVGAEMPASFNIEALKAQAVVGRTYALKSIKNGKRLTDTSSTQNYKSIDELKNMWGNNFDKYYKKVLDAVNSTKGMYLSYNGDYIDAVFHSTSNGKTENSKYVWGNSFPYLVSVDSPYDESNKSFLSINYFSNEALTGKLGQIVNNDTIYNVVTRNESGRVDTIAIDNIIYTGVELRNKLGLRSTDFDIEKLDNGVNITTRGYGHGVGMSQYGANGMANNGCNFRDILTHYYTGVVINTL